MGVVMVLIYGYTAIGLLLGSRSGGSLGLGLSLGMLLRMTQALVRLLLAV
jgi:hypothetical protein